ncbi:acyltransferase family protein [Sphingomonas sp. GB1N7]|uniref:acyltransferase family protein n=1 Tax=Parasphingomonas caseinilytica TaxID=3096158 RepID=UPI002FC69DD4
MTSVPALAADPLPQIKSNTGLRGVAALIVVAYHLQFAGYRLPFKVASDLFDRGYLMVDLFFILSGFILTYVHRAKNSVDYVDYQNFMITRFIRIYPLHIFCLSYLLIVAGGADLILFATGYKTVFLDWSIFSLKLLLAQITLINGWFFTRSGWNTPTWSISVEILSYAIFPFLAFFLTKRRIATTVILLFSALFYVIISFYFENLDFIGRIAVLRCFAGFGLGMIICHKRMLIDNISGKILSIFQLLILCGIFLAMKKNINDGMIIPLLCGLVLFTSCDRGLLSDIISGKIFQFLGKISYSIYLNHVCLLLIVQPIWSRMIVAINRSFYFDSLWLYPIFFGLVIAISTVTYRYVELPLGRYLNGLQRSRRLRQLPLVQDAT